MCAQDIESAIKPFMKKEEKSKKNTSKKTGTFGEGENVVVLVAEATEATEEALADDVAGGVLPPAVGVAAGDDVGVFPALGLRLGVEGARPLGLIPPSPTPRWRRHSYFSGLPTQPSGGCWSGLVYLR